MDNVKLKVMDLVRSRRPWYDKPEAPLAPEILALREARTKVINERHDVEIELLGFRFRLEHYHNAPYTVVVVAVTQLSDGRHQRMRMSDAAVLLNRLIDDAAKKDSK